MSFVANNRTRIHQRSQVYKNSIIFLDEFEKSINAEGAQGGPLTAAFLKLLDSNEQTIHLADLDIDIDVSDSIFILASNEPVKNSPLASRIRFSVSFPAFSAEQKMKIAFHYFAGLIAEHGLVTSNEDKAVIEEIVAHDKNPGVRILEFVLQDYFAFKLGAIAWDESSSSRHFDVIEAFTHHDQTGTKPQ